MTQIFPENSRLLVFSFVIVVLALAGCAAPNGQTSTTGDNTQVAAQDNDAAAGSEDSLAASTNPTDYAVRQRYFQEAFQPNRESYNIFEKASVFLKKPVNEIPNYFSLNSELEIFSDLPTLPADFSEVAFLLANGDTYAIGDFSENYYRQPEFYPGFKENGLSFWTEPDPKYWAPNGYGVYPSAQSDILSLSGRQEFVAVAFMYSGYGVQTYQGVTVVPTAKTLENFDVTVTPDTFLLTPTFPKFTKEWAQRIEITGKLKPNVAPGEYKLEFQIVTPPKEKKEEWKFKYRNIYFDAAAGVAPSGSPIEFDILVTN